MPPFILIIQNMSRLIKNKYIDKGSSSRISLGKSNILPMITNKRLDSFTFSLRRHINNSVLQNPQSKSQRKVQPTQYDLTKELEKQHLQTQQKCNAQSQIYRYSSVKEKRQKQEQLNWRSQSLKMKEKPMNQIYQGRVSENIKHYGAGMLRQAHRNSLGVEANEQKLLQLHYRLKKQRELQIINRQQRAAAARFKVLMSRYESI